MKDEVSIANRYVNLTYLLAGCLQNSCNTMNSKLIKVGQGLKQNNKHLLKLVIDTSHRLQSLIEQLAKISILTCDDETQYTHEDAVSKYYALMMNMVSIVGSDKYSELRAYYLYNYLEKVFEHQDIFDDSIVKDIAFYGTKQRIANGDYTDEELRTCLKEKDYDKYTNETSQG